MGGQLHLGRLFGVPIVAGFSWLLWIFVALYLMAGFFPDQIAPTEGRAFFLAVVVVVLYVIALVGHEFGHALMGRAFGIETERVELWALGGLAHLSRGSRTPKEEFFVAAAGPAVTLLAAVIAALVVGSVDGYDLRTLWQIGTLQYSGSTAVSAVAGIILFFEGLALIFNLLPALPLDGGRIARSIVWKATGRPERGTAFAAQAGKLLAGLLVLAAIWLVAETGSTFNGLMALFLAFFIWQNAQAAVIPTEPRRTQTSLVPTSAVMESSPVWVATTDTAAEADAQAFDGHGLDWAVVLDPHGRLQGRLAAERVREELAAGRPTTPAGELLSGGRGPVVRDDVLLHKLMKDKDLERLGALPVVDGDGVLVGVVSREAARQALVVEGGLRT
ncbi:site-2 protease family protein [Patulibacter sp.]|uniref:site-2 protease family protein n=1 Tax=Patulibacter sp. TaxID=1912859 RepID=UPI002726DCBE|nr:site-2 protease family protein [Patulibacter sp.]MDO9410283.1 site-2 protease family protein [Patulibacter sp.]